ncbi:peptide ABC transporter substrate-binding protein [Fodinicola acaciae]|uniref:peptide ABC transporter substrate-binding protein n=1 Tax=Fodinicola acaciae TaxID=2681555 RepID=UPI0013D1914D|nr:peptide ABC transporter substrate-binding protein [Fodinicola acaciae]
MRTIPRGWVAALLAICLALTACAGTRRQHGGGSGQPIPGGTVSFALPPSAQPNWILPLALPGYTASYNGAIQSMLFVPLYAYDGTSGSVTMDPLASAALPPKYSADSRTVTITLRPLTWSNGQRLSTRDVEFWLNLVRANKSEWAAYTEGLMPDDIVGFHAVDDRTFTLTLDKTYNPDWFTANQLTLITPLPHSAWSRTGPGTPIGDADRTAAGAKQIFTYLASRAKNLGGYATDPLWKVVDGPFALSRFSSSGAVTVARNPRYSGPDRAHLDSVSFVTFTSASAEYNVLRSGGLDYGYVPTSNLGQRTVLEKQGYRISPWNGWSITYIPYNFNNPAMGKVFSQLYVRQAIQHAVNQPAITSVIWRGTAKPDYGPVPQDNDRKYLSDRQRTNPYPYDLNRSRQLLAAHGWKAGSDGILVCRSATSCGAGVAAGTRFAMTLLTESGSDETDNTMQELKSSFSKVGIEMTINGQPLNTVLGKGTSCKPADASCAWQLSYFGTQGSWYFPANPSGEQLFATNASVNFGSYSDKRTDDLINASNRSDSGTAMVDYSAHLAEQLPVIWMPNPPYQVSAIDSALHGVVQDPLAGLQPQRWFWTR